MINSNIAIENAQIRFRNFSGKEGKFNPAGRCNFCVLLDDDMANTLEKEGWNVRWLQPRDDGAARQAYLQVAVSYENVPPKIILISSKGKTILDKDSVSLLDWAEISETDLILNPYNWEVNGKSGVKAYVKSMYVTIAEDEFEKKYEDVPANAIDSIGGCGQCEVCDESCKEKRKD